MRLRRVFSSILLLVCTSQQQFAFAHAEHGAGEPVPQIASASQLPRGVDLTIVKTTVHQFSVSSDGQQQIDVLSETGEPFIRIEKQVVLANVNSAYWFRSLQPGGGPVPARLKQGDQFLRLDPDWKPIAQQSGFGWYDARLLDENLKAFEIALRINGVKHVVRVQRKPPAAFTGYWSSRLSREPASVGLSALIPGLTTGAISLTRVSTDKNVQEVLDAAGKPFIRSASDGWWVNVNHPWFKDIGLFVNTRDPETRPDWGSSWVKASGALMLSYQDPRLKAPKGQGRNTRTWSIPVRNLDSSQVEQFAGDMQWRDVAPTGKGAAR